MMPRSRLPRLLYVALTYNNILADVVSQSQDPLPSTYPTYVNILETLQLVQTIYAPHGGQVEGLVGELLLQWLNTSHTVPATAELVRLSALEEPWTDQDFWPTLNKCILRGLSTTSLAFLRRVASHHPSSALRLFVKTELVPVLEIHPRSSDYQREAGFIAAHARWRERVAEARTAFDTVVEAEAEGSGEVEGDEDEWARWMDELLGVLEGDASVVFALCSEAVEDGWGFREAIGVWGVWVDVSLKRTQLGKVVEKVVEEMPPDPTMPVQELHRAVMAMEELEVCVGIAKNLAQVLSEVPYASFRRRWKLRRNWTPGSLLISPTFSRKSEPLIPTTKLCKRRSLARNSSVYCLTLVGS